MIFGEGARIKITEAYFAMKSVVLTQRQFQWDFLSGNFITSWLWDNVWCSLQGNPQDVCPTV